MLPAYLIPLLAILPIVLCGSPCPPRSDIYPCSCANVAITKRRLATVVTCRGVPDPSALQAALPHLMKLEIDQLHLLDAFFGAAAGQKSLPPDWLSLLNVKNMEIGDSDLDQCFICPTANCRRSGTIKLSVSNSSSSDKMCSSCGGSPKQPWTRCLGASLRELHFTQGRLTSFGADMFPVVMRTLVTLNMSRNQIVRVDPGALRMLPELVKLDLSHNAIEKVDHLFKGDVLNLQHLDISWNLIKTLGPDFFQTLPMLTFFKADNNLLPDMKEGVWRTAAKILKHIDLSNNLIHCDCGLRWVNGSFHINTILLGSCATPEEYALTPLRRASRFLNERCTSSGVLGTRAPSNPRAASTFGPPRPTRRG